MLSAAQIVLICLIGVLGLLSIGFMIAFIVEIARKEQTEEESQESQEVKSVFEININTNNEEEKTESVNEMLADLDKLTEGEVVEEEKKEEAAEEPAEETAEATETAEETTEEVVEAPAEETAEATEAVEETKAEGEEVVINIIDDSHEPIVPGSLIDYETRLAKVIENRDKIEKELVKTQKSILKYERTIRRKDRNQKLLDRRAGELTNLNLLMYSVTDIKNVDEDKKVKQEELTAHIAELKASIQDAEEYIESNKSKYNHDLSVVKYLTEEKKRYDEEVAELESLIKAINEGTDTAEGEN